MANSIDIQKTDKLLLKELLEAIRSERKSQIGDVEEGHLYTIRRELNTKNLSKYEYRQLAGLYKFMVANPELSIGRIAQIIFMKPIVLGFLNNCVRHIRDFLQELKQDGVDSMAEQLAIRNSLINTDL